MFDNLLYQKTSELLIQDINNSRVPGAILLSGPESSGKLTCALETARILSCSGTKKYPKGHWLCDCPSCKKNKALVNTNIILAGPRDCQLEISAAKRTFLQAAANNENYLRATHYLFVRAVRKLTMRFSQVLWEGNDKLNKLSVLTQAVEEQLEKIDFDRELPDFDTLVKICDDITKNTLRLEEDFMYDSIPVDQIRRASSWARLKSHEGKKVFIIENADRMLENVRNALLKILEEPPEDTVFILTTSRRGAVMPTILSRVRTYDFYQRTFDQESEVIERVFHDKFRNGNKNLGDYLQVFLPVTPSEIFNYSKRFYDGIQNNQIFQLDTIVKGCASFKPKILLKLFLRGLYDCQKTDENSLKNTELSFRNVEAVRECFNNVTIYNQSPLAALEKLYRDMASNRNMFLR